MNYPVHENVVTIPLDKIIVKPDRYRTELGDIESLAESIKERGQLIPIIVSDDFVLIAGERRYRAHEMLALPTINVLIRTHNEIDSKITEILENLERKEFTWDEQVLALDDLHNLFSATNEKWSERKTAAKAGLSSGGVSTDLNIADALKTDPEMFKGCKTKQQALKVLKKYNIDETMAEMKLRKTKTNYGVRAQNYVFHGDCNKLIDSLPAGIVNAIISDPVYGLNINEVKKRDGAVNIYEDDDQEYFNIMRTVISKMPRILSDNAAVVIFCRIENFYWLHKVLGEHGIVCDPIPGIWFRGGGQTMSPNRNMARSYEAFIYGFKGEGQLIRPGLSNVLQYSGVNPMHKQHDVQKPLALMEEIISRFCLPGAKILDFMCGSNTTGVAAIKRGCDPIGFELSEENYNTCLSRVADVLNAKDAGKLDLINDNKG